MSDRCTTLREKGGGWTMRRYRWALASSASRDERIRGGGSPVRRRKSQYVLPLRSRPVKRGGRGCV